MNDKRFPKAVAEHFDFLTQSHEFTRCNIEPSVLPEMNNSETSVRYEGPHIFIYIYEDRGVVGVEIFAKVHTSILRPAGKRFFSLWRILQLIAPELMESFPRTEGCEAILLFYAEALRKYCDPLLRMDMKLLEEVYARMN